MSAKRTGTRRRRTRRSRRVGGNYESMAESQPRTAMSNDDSSVFEERIPNASVGYSTPSPAIPPSQPLVKEPYVPFSSTKTTPTNPSAGQDNGFFGNVSNGLTNAKSKLFNWFSGVPNQSGGRRKRTITRNRRSRRRSATKRRNSH